METSPTTSLVITKKTGALVFFVGCAVGLIISEILVGVASQKAQQDAHRASLDYIEQARYGGNGSFAVKQETLTGARALIRRRHHANLTPGEHIEAVQTGIMVSRIGSQAGQAALEKTRHQLEEQKMRHRLRKEHAESVQHAKSKRRYFKRRQYHKSKASDDAKISDSASIPDTIGLLRIRGGSKDGVLAHICTNKDDKNCINHNSKAPRRRTKRRVHRKRHYDVRTIGTNGPPPAVILLPVKPTTTDPTINLTTTFTTSTVTTTITVATTSTTTTRKTAIPLRSSGPPIVHVILAKTTKSVTAKDPRHIEGPLKPIRTGGFLEIFRSRGTPAKNQTSTGPKPLKKYPQKHHRKDPSKRMFPVLSTVLPNGTVVILTNDKSFRKSRNGVADRKKAVVNNTNNQSPKASKKDIADKKKGVLTATNNQWPQTSIKNITGRKNRILIVPNHPSPKTSKKEIVDRREAALMVTNNPLQKASKKDIAGRKKGVRIVTNNQLPKTSKKDIAGRKKEQKQFKQAKIEEKKYNSTDLKEEKKARIPVRKEAVSASNAGWGSFPFRTDDRPVAVVTSPDSQFWEDPLVPPNDNSQFLPSDGQGPNVWSPTNTVSDVTQVGNSLDVPPPTTFDHSVRKNLKSERACRRMMKDMETFEKDEQMKSEELMMVSFRDGVDEVQNLMHTWIKTPVHVMEGITFFSVLICLVLYWVEDSIQNRLRKIGFNI